MLTAMLVIGVAAAIVALLGIVVVQHREIVRQRDAYREQSELLMVSERDLYDSKQEVQKLMARLAEANDSVQRLRRQLTAVPLHEKVAQLSATPSGSNERRYHGERKSVTRQVSRYSRLNGEVYLGDPDPMPLEPDDGEGDDYDGPIMAAVMLSAVQPSGDGAAGVEFETPATPHYEPAPSIPEPSYFPPSPSYESTYSPPDPTPSPSYDSGCSSTIDSGCSGGFDSGGASW